MELKKENFKKLVQLAVKMPRLSNIMVKYRVVKAPVGEHRVSAIQTIVTDAIIFDEKINKFLSGDIPDLSLAERRGIRKFFPFKRQLQIHNLSIQVMNDITENAESISDQSQLKRYLQNMADELDPIVCVIKEIARIDEFNANNIYPYPLDEGLTLEQKESKELLLELLLRDNVFFYVTFKEVKDHIDHIRHDEGFIDLDKEYKIEHAATPQSKHTQQTYGLLHYYLSKTGEGVAINETNKNDLAKKYGFTSLTSGTALKNEYSHFKEDTNRLNLTQIMKTDKTLNERFKAVIEILRTDNKSLSFDLAKDEYSIFFKKFQAEYM